MSPSSWVKNYGDYLLSLALMKTGNREVAEDLVQDTFLSAIRNKDSFRGASSEKTWLVTILKNKITDYYRKKDVLRNTDSYLSETEDAFNNAFFEENGHWKTSSAPAEWNTDTKINQSEFQRILQFCLSKLPPKLLPVFVAKFLDEQESDEICKEQEISSSNYWVIVHRAKVLMRACLETNWINK